MIGPRSMQSIDSCAMILLHDTALEGALGSLSFPQVRARYCHSRCHLPFETQLEWVIAVEAFETGARIPLRVRVSPHDTKESNWSFNMIWLWQEHYDIEYDLALVQDETAQAPNAAEVLASSMLALTMGSESFCQSFRCRVLWPGMRLGHRLRSSS